MQLPPTAIWNWVCVCVVNERELEIKANFPNQAVFNAGEDERESICSSGLAAGAKAGQGGRERGREREEERERKRERWRERETERKEGSTDLLKAFKVHKGDGGLVSSDEL